MVMVLGRTAFNRGVMCWKVLFHEERGHADQVWYVTRMAILNFSNYRCRLKTRLGNLAGAYIHLTGNDGNYD